MVIKQHFLFFIQQSKVYHLLFALMTTLLFITLSNPLYAASVTASLNKNTVTENDIIQLTLRADFSNTGNGPDLTPLQRDFDILGKNQNGQFGFNLGTSTTLNFWTISLRPKSVGTFEIPPIKIGDHESKIITVTVKNSPQLMDSNGNPPVILKTEASKTELYLQQEVILKVKLYTSVALQNANRSVPSHPDLIVERLIDDQISYEIINGSEYQVRTQEYLAFPQSSGLLSVPPQTLQAMISTSSGRRVIKVQSEPLKLQVLPIPASYSSDSWLPSKNVSISTSLEQTSESPRIGDTLIWVINIEATGALPEQISTPNLNSTRNYKLYPKSPKFSSQKTVNGVVGVQTITVEVVPTEEGSLVLPDISLTYWNTETRTISTAIASTESLSIAPLPDSQKIKEASNDKQISEPLAAQPRSVAPISLAKKTIKETIESDKPSPIKAELIRTERSLPFKDYLIAGLLILALCMIGMWIAAWFKKRKSVLAEINNHVPTLQEFAPLSTADEQSAYKALIACCQQNNLSQLRSSLLEWSRHRWGDDEIRSVDDIKRLTSVHVTQLLMEAELMLYSNNPMHEWQGESLADALEEYTTGQAKPSQSSQLKTLYPNF